MMTKKVRIKQHDITDCGAACLASVAAHYDLHLPLSRIRQCANTNQRGTSALGMVEAAEKIGFQAKGVRGDLESLAKIPKPTIAHVVLDNQLQHYVVIYGVTDNFVTIMDPSDGQIRNQELSVFEKEWSGVLILLIPNEHFKKENQKVAPFKRFWYLIEPHKLIAFQIIFGAAIYTLLGLSTAIYIQKITDYVLPDSNQNLLNLMSVSMIAILFLQIGLGIIKSIFSLKIGQKIDAQLILGYYKHLLTLPQHFFDTMRVGEIISRVNDAVKIRVFINEIAVSIIVNSLVIVFSLGLMFTYYWKLALILTIIVPLYGCIYWIASKYNKTQQRKLMESAAELESHLVESITAISTIKQFGIEPFFNVKTENKFIKLLRAIFNSGITNIYTVSSNEFISRLFTIILLWTGGYYVIRHEITPGELLSFYSLIGYLTTPASQLIASNKSFQEAMIAADRLFEIIDIEREESNEKIDLISEFVGDIKLINVCFRYGGRNLIFDNLNLTIPKGQITAIVGESGSGKSTLISLLQNLYPIQSGIITVGDFNLHHIKNDDLRKKVVVVPQQVSLFAGNIIENIALGDYSPDLRKVVKICHELSILDFIQKQPNGFDTYIGENGLTLSGGQRQRIAIARALYRDPEVLILDEATSSLDTNSEKYVHKAINKLRQNNKTILIIAHRLSTIKTADKIVVIDKGKVLSEGKHEELIENSEFYKNLWNQQFEII